MKNKLLLFVSLFLLPQFFLSSLGNLQLQLFYGRARVKLSHFQPAGIPIDTASGGNSYHIAGAGLGMSLTKNDQYRIIASWARKIGHNPGRDASTGFDSDGKDDNYRFWLQGVVWF